MRIGAWFAGQWARFTAPRNELISISDPRALELFEFGAANFSGTHVNEASAMALSAVYRAVALIAGTIGTLPLRAMMTTADGRTQPQSSDLFANPGGAYGQTPMSWTETVVAHLLLHGNAFLRKIYGGAGQVIQLCPVHPLLVSIELPLPDDEIQPLGGKWFRMTLINGTQLRLDAKDVIHVMGLSLDGIEGISVIAAARNGLGTAIAGDRAAAKMFSQGGLVSGILTTDDDVDDTEAKAINEKINVKITGWENASRIPFVNRNLKFQQWTMSAADMQFLQSRAFQIEEIARWFGVPPHLLMQTDKQTSWGTGVEEQNNGLSRFTLNGWTCRIEQSLSRLLVSTRWVEFDYSGLVRPTPEDEIALIIAQLDADLITVNEARALRNLLPLPGGDVVKSQFSAPAPTPQPADDQADDPESVPA